MSCSDANIGLRATDGCCAYDAWLQIMQGRIIKVLNMKPIETSGMIAEAAGTKYYENREKEVVKLIQKKDIKLVEIDRVMNDDIKPKLEQLQVRCCRSCRGSHHPG